jgi:hypothetical protein
MRRLSVWLVIRHKEGWFRLAIVQLDKYRVAAWFNLADRGSARMPGRIRPASQRAFPVPGLEVDTPLRIGDGLFERFEQPAFLGENCFATALAVV